MSSVTLNSFTNRSNMIGIVGLTNRTTMFLQKMFTFDVLNPNSDRCIKFIADFRTIKNAKNFLNTCPDPSLGGVIWDCNETNNELSFRIVNENNSYETVYNVPYMQLNSSQIASGLVLNSYVSGTASEGNKTKLCVLDDYNTDPASIPSLYTNYTNAKVLFLKGEKMQPSTFATRICLGFNQTLPAQLSGDYFFVYSQLNEALAVCLTAMDQSLVESVSAEIMTPFFDAEFNDKLGTVTGAVIAKHVQNSPVYYETSLNIPDFSGICPISPNVTVNAKVISAKYNGNGYIEFFVKTVSELSNVPNQNQIYNNLVSGSKITGDITNSSISSMPTVTDKIPVYYRGLQQLCIFDQGSFEKLGPNYCKFRVMISIEEYYRRMWMALTFIGNHASN